MSFTREVMRKDSKIRMLGDRAYFGDQEVIGNFKVYDNNENLIFHVDPSSGLIKYYDTNGNLIFVFDTSTGRVIYYKTNGDEVYRFDPSTGDLTINGEKVNTSAELFSHLSIEHFWTGSDTYIDRTGCRFAIDGDNFHNQNVYYECVMANEQSGRTAYTRIYNITDDEPLSGSEISTTANPLSNLTRVRSGVLTFPSGLKEYKLQIRMNQTGGEGDNAHFYAARLVITQQ